MKNRTIRFRAWDKQYKEMVEVNFMSFNTNELDHNKNLNEPKSLEHFDIMQFTGAEDKNGKPIYEGDILSEMVECDGEMVPSKEVVFYSNEEFMWCVDMSLKRDGSYYSPLRELMLSKYEIIGNRYQNSDLLKNK